MISAVVLLMFVAASGTSAVNDDSMVFYREKPKFRAVKLGVKGYVQEPDAGALVVSPKEDGIDVEDDVDEMAAQEDPLNFTLGVQSRIFGGYRSGSNQAISSFPSVIPYPNPLGKLVKVFQIETETRIVPPLCIACSCMVGPAAPCALCDYDTAPPGPFVVATTPCLLGETKCTAYCVDPEILGPPISRPAVCGTPCECRTAGTAVPCSPPANGVISPVLDACPSSLKKRREAPQLLSSRDEDSLDMPPERQGRILGLFKGVNVVHVTSTVTKSILGRVTATYPAGGLRCLPGDLAASPLC